MVQPSSWASVAPDSCHTVPSATTTFACGAVSASVGHERGDASPAGIEVVRAARSCPCADRVDAERAPAFVGLRSTRRPTASTSSAAAAVPSSPAGVASETGASSRNTPSSTRRSPAASVSASSSSNTPVAPDSSSPTALDPSTAGHTRWRTSHGAGATWVERTYGAKPGTPTSIDCDESNSGWICEPVLGRRDELPGERFVELGVGAVGIRLQDHAADGLEPRLAGRRRPFGAGGIVRSCRGHCQSQPRTGSATAKYVPMDEPDGRADGRDGGRAGRRRRAHRAMRTWSSDEGAGCGRLDRRRTAPRVGVRPTIARTLRHHRTRSPHVDVAPVAGLPPVTSVRIGPLTSRDADRITAADRAGDRVARRASAAGAPADGKGHEHGAAVEDRRYSPATRRSSRTNGSRPSVR